LEEMVARLDFLAMCRSVGIAARMRPQRGV